MWYATEKVFIDVKFFRVSLLFADGEISSTNLCYNQSEEQVNRHEKMFNGQIEIRANWLEVEDLTYTFYDGKFIYIYHYQAFSKAP